MHERKKKDKKIQESLDKIFSNHIHYTLYTNRRRTDRQTVKLFDSKEAHSQIFLNLLKDEELFLLFYPKKTLLNFFVNQFSIFFLYSNKIQN